MEPVGGDAECADGLVPGMGRQSAGLDLLVQVFFRAIDTFLVDAFVDPKRKAVIETRLGQMLTSMAYKPEQN
jgi:hypothetical protein